MLVVILDGVRTEEITSDWASDLTGMSGQAFARHTWDDLAPDATVVREILNPVLASTAPGHATLVTGRAEPLFTVGFLSQGAALYRPLVPTIFEEARSQRGWVARDAVLMANSVVMQGVNSSLYPGLDDVPGTWELLEGRVEGEPDEDDSHAVSVLRDRIAQEPSPIIMVNLHDADRVAHADGDYPARVEEQDKQLAGLWRWLEDRQPEYLDGLLMVVTSDHGRHRHTLDGGWLNHGDACTGCREIPLILAGEGVARGQVVVDGSYSLLDIAPTLAAHMGLELPLAQGMPLSPLVRGLEDAPVRSGDVDLSVSGGRTATRRWRPDFAARSEVVVDGEVVSTPGILAAEAPRLLAGSTGSWVCFRELSATESAGYLPWRPRCLYQEAAAETDWQDIGFPDAATGPFFSAALLERDGTLWAAWLHTPLTRGVDGVDEVWLASWTPAGGWSTAYHYSTIFTTTDVVLTQTDDHLVIAATTNLEETDAPYTRRITLRTFSPSTLTFGAEQTFSLESLLSSPRRVEHAALSAEGSRVRLAMHAIEADQRSLVWVESTDGGLSWSEPARLPGEGTPFLHIPPLWSGDTLVWASLLEDNTAALCRLSPGDAAASPACSPLDSPRIDSFQVQQDNTAQVSVDAAVGAWEIREVRW